PKPPVELRMNRDPVARLQMNDRDRQGRPVRRCVLPRGLADLLRSTERVKTETLGYALLSLTRTPASSFPSAFTSPSALAKMFAGLARRLSSPRLTGVRPKPIAIEGPSGQYAISPAVTTARASGQRAILTGTSK